MCRLTQPGVMNNVRVSARVVESGEVEGMGEGQAMGSALHFAVMLAAGLAVGMYMKPQGMKAVPTRTAFLLVMSRLMIGMIGAVIAGQLAWGLEWYSKPGDWTQVAISLTGAAVLLYAYSRKIRSVSNCNQRAQPSSATADSTKGTEHIEV